MSKGAGYAPTSPASRVNWRWAAAAAALLAAGRRPSGQQHALRSLRVCHPAAYSYLGPAAIVEVTSAQATLKSTLVGVVGGTDPDTGDIYRGLDRFGRVKDLLWYNTGTATTVEEVQHGYDRAGNRLWRADPADLADRHDELYAYDGLHRLAGLQRGGLNAAKSGLTAETFGQCWSLDATGTRFDAALAVIQITEAGVAETCIGLAST
jgi:hypothetical protein